MINYNTSLALSSYMSQLRSVFSIKSCIGTELGRREEKQKYNEKEEKKSNEKEEKKYNEKEEKKNRKKKIGSI